MKTLYKFLRAGVISALFVQVGFAQKENVGIGTTKPDQSAILDLSSTNKGLLMPRVTLQQRSSIQNPANGLIVYQTDLLSGFYYFDGKEWKSVGAETAQKSVTDAFNWGLTGNAGTNPSTNFIGTSDNQSLRFRANNQKAGFIDLVGSNTFFGLYSGDVTNSATGIENVGIGEASMLSNTSGRSNLALGVNAMRLNTTGNFNTAIGKNSLRSNTISTFSVAIGSNALQNFNGTTNVGENIAIGGNAMLNTTTGISNTAIGSGALAGNLTGSGNIAVGGEALGAKTLGDNNTAIGNFSGQNNITGSRNVFIGYLAGRNEATSDKLYVASSATTTPLVYGDMSADFLALGGVDATPAKRDALSAQYGLLVRKGILTEKIKVATMTSADWADYVFEDNYKRLSLEEVEAFIKEHKHLPNVPSTAEMMTNGNDIQKTDAKLLEKIEELTLYMIEMNKQFQILKKENTKLKFKIK